MPQPTPAPPPDPPQASLPERILKLIETIIYIVGTVLSLGLFKPRTKRRTPKDRPKPPTTDRTPGAEE